MTGTAGLADLLAAAVADGGRPAGRVRTDDFLLARSLRLEAGRDDPVARYERWVDVAALRRETLDPLGPGGSRRWVRTFWDAERDRATREPARQAPRELVLVVDGPFLLRPELAGALDVVVHLDLSTAAIERRAGELGPHEGAALGTAWRVYLERCAPARRADHLVRWDHPNRPALLEQSGGRGGPASVAT